MRKRITGGLSLLLVLCLLAGGCGKETQEEEAAPEESVAVEIRTVEKGAISAESSVSGQVAAGDQQAVFVALSAQCRDVYVEVGDAVSAGQVLCTLDISSTLDNIKTADMNLENTRKSFQAQSALLNEQLQQAGDQLALAEKNLSDTQALFEIGAASQLEIDNARLAVEGAQLAVNNLRTSLQTAQDQYDLAVQNSQAALNQLESSLNGVDRSGNVAAPISGTIVALNAARSAFSSPAAPLATIESTSDREISAGVSESLISKLSVGSLVHVSIEAAGVDFQGTIDSIDNSANPVTHLYGVTVKVPAGLTSALRSGMFAEITFYTDTQRNVVVIPTEAILTGIDGSYVFTLDSENIAHKIPVETGLVGDGITEITGGLTGGEVLVTVGQFYLTDGAAVRVVAHGG